MKYAKAILGSIALFVLFDILISVMIPDRVMNVIFVVVASLVLVGVLLAAFGTATKNRWGHQLRGYQLPRLRFSDATGAPTEVPERKALGWWYVREMWVRDGQMGSPVVVRTFPVRRQIGH